MIKTNNKIENDTLLLRPISVDDCTHQYIAWLNNPKVNQYLETRWHTQTEELVKRYIINMMKSQNNELFAIIIKNSQQHIGNIKLGNVNRYHANAEISYFIGETGYWGKGYATKAVQLLTDYALKDKKLYALKAGVYASNKGSCRVLEKVGYTLQGVLVKQLQGVIQREDHLWYGIQKTL